MIYFILSGQYVKIGRAECVIERMSDLQISSPEELILLGVVPGGAVEERRLHSRFAAMRTRGEWFHYTAEIRTYIIDAAVPYQPRSRAERGRRRGKRRNASVALYPVPDKRIRVWVQKFNNRRNLMLQWHDPVSGRRLSKSAGTHNRFEAELRAADLEGRLNDEHHQRPGRADVGADVGAGNDRRGDEGAAVA